jgi:D-ornithine 4,5-aminomutase subunit alpha
MRKRDNCRKNREEKRLNAERFEQRRKELSTCTDEELNRIFWELAERIVNPLVDLAYENTSPSIERSVLLRMGFDSLVAKSFVEKCFERGLLGRGAGHVIVKVAEYLKEDYLRIGREMAEGNHWGIADMVFKGVPVR